MDPRKPYRPIGDNPDPQQTPQVIDPPETPSPANNPDPDETPPEPSDPAPDAVNPLPRNADENPAHDASAAPDA